MAKILSAQQPASAPKPKILAVDDKPEILAALADMLKEEFIVIGVTSGATALKALKKHTPICFILDIEMPQMDGYELAKQIKSDERFYDTPIIFLTGKSDQDLKIEMDKYGFEDYLFKPVEKNLLFKKIRQLIGHI